MKVLLPLLVLFPVFLSIAADDDMVCNEFITKWTLWEDPGPGLAAKIKVPVEEDVDEWSIELKFNKNFTKLNFFNSGQSDDETGDKFLVRNQDWSGKKKKGDFVKFALLGDYEHQEKDLADITIEHILFNGSPLCGSKMIHAE